MSLSGKERFFYLAVIPLTAAAIGSAATMAARQPEPRVVVVPLNLPSGQADQSRLAAEVATAVRAAEPSNDGEWGLVILASLVIIGFFGFWPLAIWIAGRS